MSPDGNHIMIVIRFFYENVINPYSKKLPSYISIKWEGFIMTLQELLNIIDKFKLKHQDNNVKVNSTKDTRITRKALLDSNMSIIAEKEMSDGKISVFEDGYVLYEDMDNYTIFLISECKNYNYTTLGQYEGRTSRHVPYENMEYTDDYMLNQDWAVALTLIGMDRIESNRDKRNLYIPMENVTFDGSDNYDKVLPEYNIVISKPDTASDFTEDVVLKVDVENAISSLTLNQRGVLYARYWDNKAFQEIGMKNGGDSRYARQRAKATHDRANSATDFRM